MSARGSFKKNQSGLREPRVRRENEDEASSFRRKKTNCWLYGESGSVISLRPSSGTNKVKGALWGLIVLAGEWSPSPLLLLLSRPTTSEEGWLCLTPTARRNVCLFIELPHLVKDDSLSLLTTFFLLSSAGRCIFSRLIQFMPLIARRPLCIGA